MKPKRVIATFNGLLTVLNERGEIWQQQQDRQHTPPGEPKMLWVRIPGPPAD